MSQVIDHVSLGVSDLDLAQGFYDAVLAALGFRRLYSKPGSVTYGLGPGSDDFSIVQDANSSSRPGAHLAPGFRPEYHAGYYAAFAIDVDGNRIEAVCHIRSP